MALRQQNSILFRRCPLPKRDVCGKDVGNALHRVPGGASAHRLLALRGTPQRAFPTLTVAACPSPLIPPPLAPRAGMIETIDLCKRHGKLEVLRGISLAVAEGEVAVIVGP